MKYIPRHSFTYIIWSTWRAVLLLFRGTSSKKASVFSVSCLLTFTSCFPGPSRILQHHWSPRGSVSVRGRGPQVVPHRHVCEERRGGAQLGCAGRPGPDRPDGLWQQMKHSGLSPLNFVFFVFSAPFSLNCSHYTVVGWNLFIYLWESKTFLDLHWLAAYRTLPQTRSDLSTTKDFFSSKQVINQSSHKRFTSQDCHCELLSFTTVDNDSSWRSSGAAFRVQCRSSDIIFLIWTVIIFSACPYPQNIS